MFSISTSIFGLSRSEVGRVLVFDPVVVDTVQYLVEASGNPVKVFQRQFTMVQLAIGEDLVDQVLNQSLDSRRGRVV
jgi:hypothetical protein